MTTPRAAALDRALANLAGTGTTGTTPTPPVPDPVPAIPALGSHVQESPDNYTPDRPFRAGHVIGVEPEEGTGEPLLRVLDHIRTWEPREAVTHVLRLSDVDPNLTVPARETARPFAAHVDAALVNAAAAHGALGRARKASAVECHRAEFHRWWALAVRLVAIEDAL